MHNSLDSFNWKLGNLKENSEFKFEFDPIAKNKFVLTTRLKPLEMRKSSGKIILKPIKRNIKELDKSNEFSPEKETAIMRTPSTRRKLNPIDREKLKSTEGMKRDSSLPRQLCRKGV